MRKLILLFLCAILPLTVSAYDVEVNSMLSEGATPQDLTNMINSYCKLMQQAGFYPIVYANKKQQKEIKKKLKNPSFEVRDA